MLHWAIGLLAQRSDSGNAANFDQIQNGLPSSICVLCVWLYLMQEHFKVYPVNS